MAATSALHTAGLVTGAPAARLAQAAAWAKNSADPLDVRTGIVYSGNQSLLTATATMQVKVSALHFAGSKTGTQGVYVGANDGDYLLTIAAAPGSGSRTDVVYIMQQDSNPGTTSPDATTAPLIAATSGALPAGAVRIGSVVVPAGITKLTDAGVVVTTDCQFTVAVGSPIPVRDFTDRDATITSPYLGMTVVWIGSSGSGFEERYNGTTWTPLHTFREHMGAINQPALVASGALTGPYPQTFPTGRFTQAPKIQFGVEGSRLVAFATAITTAGFNLYLRNVAASDSPSGAEVINWMATQRTPNVTTG